MTVLGNTPSDQVCREPCCKVCHIGNRHPVGWMTPSRTIEDALGEEAQKDFLPMQPGDVVATYADVEDLKRDVGFEPKTPLAEGIARWAEWYRSYHGMQR